MVFDYLNGKVKVIIGYSTDAFIFVNQHAAVGIVDVIIARAVTVNKAGGCITCVSYTCQQLVALSFGGTV